MLKTPTLQGKLAKNYWKRYVYSVWCSGLFDRLRIKFGNKCVVCGLMWNLQFAHLKETELSGTEGRGRKERYYDIKKHPDCYALMCKKHHEEFDHQYGNKLEWLKENRKF